MSCRRSAIRVSYTIEVCNTGLVAVDRDSVIDSLIGDITDEFLATLAPGACDEVVLSRDVVAGDPDPLENTVTATYTGWHTDGHRGGE